MRVLIVHNSYRGFGGEDTVATMEAKLLRESGHEVVEYLRSNREINTLYRILTAPLSAVWGSRAAKDVELLIRHHSPDIIHVHNTWMVISPAVYWVAKRHHVPVVQTLHNYRLVCPNAQFLREDQPCELCKKKVFPINGIVNGCYRGSRLQSLLVGLVIATHRVLGTWQSKVDCYIALTDFAKRRFVEGGLPQHKVTVRPNFVVKDPGGKADRGQYVLFVGRLSKEKGVLTLVQAWKNLHDIPLKIAGDGPLYAQLCDYAANSPSVELLGWCERDRIIELLKGAVFLIFPSIWYEGFPTTIADAFACGLPVIASRIGGLSEIVRDESTGLLFQAGDEEELASKVRWGWENPSYMEEAGKRARQTYERCYSKEQCLSTLLAIYEQMLDGEETVRVEGG